MKKYKYATSFSFDGRRYKVRADTLEELYTKKANKMRDLEEGRVILSGNTTVSQWEAQCRETYRTSVKDETQEGRILRFKKYIAPLIGSLPLRSVRPIQCQQVLNQCAGMSYSHVKKLKNELQFLFRTAADNKLILEDPTTGLQLPDYVRGHRRSISDSERRHLLACADVDPAYKLFLLMLFCGCRPMEAAGCQGKDLVKKDGVYMLHIRGTKTVNSDRWVPVPDYLLDRIKDTPPFEYIAPNAAGRKHTKSSYTRLSERLKRDMNISMGCKLYRNKLLPPYPLAADFVPYCLRHTYCTDLARKGVDIRTAQKLMGHASISMTADIYTHVDSQLIKSAAEKIGCTVEGVPQGVPSKCGNR